MFDIHSLSLREKIAQMLLVGFRGLSLDSESKLVNDIFDYGCGGVILFNKDVPSKQDIRNIHSPAQVQKLTAQLQERSRSPLFIAIDQEGGRVARLNPQNGFPNTPSHKELGEQDSLPTTRSRAMEIAGMLSIAGINLNLAPCVDVNVNPLNPVIGGLGRSFSSAPNIVALHAAQYIQGHHDFNIACSLKHFPGHGSSLDDSHLGLVDVSNTWQPLELEPYRRLISENLADSIMTAHVFNQQLDPDFPATLSDKVINDLLRNKLGYNGVVISDDLQMQAIAKYYDLETVLERSVSAGVDILLFGNNSVYDESIVERAVSTVESLIASGKLSEARINESVQRIQKLKSRMNHDRR